MKLFLTIVGIIIVQCNACFSQILQDFILVGKDSNAVVFLPANSSENIALAIDDLINDVEKISGTKLKIVNKVPDQLNFIHVEIDSSLGEWEAYKVYTRDGNLYISGSDERGAMFGIYHFIEEYLEVDPMYFWSGIEPEMKEILSWKNISLLSKGPSIKFRGWFINDEDLLTYWKDDIGKRKLDYKFYGDFFKGEVISHIAEAAVRSRFNLIIPASFLDILNPEEEELVKACSRRGLFISQHHQEPMGVSPFAFFKYWEDRGKEVAYSYYSHKDEIQEVWTAATKKWASYPNVIWQLGLRGIGDRPIWWADNSVPDSDEDRGQLISNAIKDQIDILNQVDPNRNHYTTLTLWAEGSVLNEKGFLKFPEETMIIFSDNSPGWKWQQDFYKTPRNPENSFGVYYHHALIGSGPHLAQGVSPHKTFELIKTAWQNGAGSYAVFNISNVREFVLGIDATSKMTWDMDMFDPESWFENWVEKRFSQKQDEILNAYKIYFNAFEIDEMQGVPFLLDGQTLSQGKTNLNEIQEKLNQKRIGRGTTLENFQNSNPVDNIFKVDNRSDSFTHSLSDAHPKNMGRRELIKRASMQRIGFRLALLQANIVVDTLPKKEFSFLWDNLIYHTSLMHQISTWFEQIGLAHEALDAGDIASAINFMQIAEEAMAKTGPLKERYCQGKWQTWYHGEIIFNLSATLATTRSVLDLMLQAKI